VFQKFTTGFRRALLGFALSSGSLFGLAEASCNSCLATVQLATMTTIEAIIIERGAVCPRARLASGENVSLMGVDRNLAVGSRIKMMGQFVRFSNCQQGRTFHASTYSTTPNEN
jgi:hypothetical protein